MYLTYEEARAYNGTRSTLYQYGEKIQELNDGKTEIWIKDFDLNIIAYGSPANVKFKNGEVIIYAAGARIRISLEKEKMVCDGQESHNRIISWMDCNARWLYELEKVTEAKKHVIL